ncbi:capsular polysaccharide transport system permease protein (plasmid) [Ensifer sp. WSM1721]|uniref:hypothetical protein n=1 Tax=Ensifer sp. WSM1721 TaxID=1041159 RepID=UPI00047A943A|nr:hypothetical protein [Ensifer sp. WSM1721]
MTTNVKLDENEQLLTLTPASIKGELQAFPSARAIQPQSARIWEKGRQSLLFLSCVVIPLLLSVIYNFVIASERFTSTASFIVRENQSSNGLLSLVASNGISRSDDNSYAIVEYMQSRDAISWLNSDGLLERVFNAGGVDVFSKFPSFFSGRTKEDLFQHFQSYVDVEFKQVTGVTTISVQAFNPADAKALADKLLQGAESLVNLLNERIRADSIRSASSMVEEATADLQAVQKQLTDFRNDEGILDPGAEATISNKVLTGTMGEISKVNAQLSVLLATTPNSPAIRQLQGKRDALEKQLSRQRDALAGGNDSLAKKIEAYEQVSLQRKLAEKRLLSAVASLAAAKQDFEGKRIYVARVVEPNLPDRFSHPRGFLNVFLTLAIGFAIFWIVRSMMRLLLEEV